MLVSDDGESWEQVATVEGVHEIYRIDLRPAKPRCRYVRIERDGDCLHLKRILVYGHRSS